MVKRDKEILTMEDVVIETVKNEEEDKMNGEDLLEAMGIEMEYVEEGNGVKIPVGYRQLDLSELYDDDRVEGKPYLSEIQVAEFEKKDSNGLVVYDDDGVAVTEKKYRIDLVLIDDEAEEATTIKINLKSDETIQKNVHHQSKLFALVKGILAIKTGGIDAMGDNNRLKVVNLDMVRKQLDEIDNMAIKVIEVDATNFTYNTFAVVKEL